MGHIVTRYDNEMMEVHAAILGMGAAVIKQIEAAIAALAARDVNSSQKVIDQDKAIDRAEKSVDENILQIIAKRSPVARDLRMLMAVSKVTTDIERIGDKATKIARLTIRLFNKDIHVSPPDEKLFSELEEFGKLAIQIMTKVLAAFQTFDLSMAKEALTRQNDIEQKFHPELRRLMTRTCDMDNMHSIEQAINVVFIIKAFDRIVDHSVNIAEQLVFLIEGEDVRHSYNK